jgi:hypothetical protein
MERTFSVRHECFQNRGGIAETFPEHSLIWARDPEEAIRNARQIPLDSRRRRLVSVTEIPWAPPI